MRSMIEACFGIVVGLVLECVLVFVVANIQGLEQPRSPLSLDD